MSTNQRRTREGPAYGKRTFDLSTDRSTDDLFESVWLTETSVFTPTQVPDECYLRFGSKESSRLDLREFEGRPIRSQDGGPFGVSYLENPSSTSGTLELTVGLALAGSGGPILNPLARVLNNSPGANTNVQSGGSDLDVVPLDVGTLVIHVTLASPAVFNVQETIDGTTVEHDAQTGGSLTAGAGFVFTLPCRPDATYNFQVEDAVEIDKLQVDYTRQVVL